MMCLELGVAAWCVSGGEVQGLPPAWGQTHWGCGWGRTVPLGDPGSLLVEPCGQGG